MSTADDDIAEQLREALRFLSHDAREGHSSTLTLLELHRSGAEPALSTELVQRLERTASRSLRRIDDFVALARARAHPIELEELDLLDLLYNAVSDAWQAAEERGVRLKVVDAPEQALVQADRSLLDAAVGNLVRHALGCARRGSVLQCAVRELVQAWSVEIDETPNRAALPAGGATAPAPTQYGWALVDLVARRMGGAASHRDASDHGVRLRVSFPRT